MDTSSEKAFDSDISAIEPPFTYTFTEYFSA